MSVVKRLIREGVNPDQLTVAGRGDNAPVGDNSTRDGRKENRRTEVKPNPDVKVLSKIGGN
jgi:flagellar motor protein MotB